MSMLSEAYASALKQNDQAHWKSFVDAERDGNLTKERIQEISEESLLWLRHLESIHRSETSHVSIKSSKHHDKDEKNTQCVYPHERSFERPF